MSTLMKMSKKNKLKGRNYKLSFIKKNYYRFLFQSEILHVFN